jgi:DNA-binding transcriptional LysR family regulator
MLDELFVFLKIVESSSLAEAARVLKISNATVARRLAALEKTLGVRLIDRNTRAMSLTQAGQDCYDRCQSIPNIIDEMMNTTKSNKGSLQGSLDISIATYSGYHELLPKLVAFRNLHPALKLNISKSNVFPDLIDNSFHAYVRYDEVQTRSMTSIILTEHQMCLCAAKDYLANAPPIDSLGSLSKHQCIIHQYNRHEGDEWEFLVDGKQYFQKINGSMMYNNSALVIEAIEAGGGIGYLPTYFVESLPNISVLLPTIWPKAKPVFLTYPRGEHIYEKIRVFVDFLQASYRE